MDYETGRSKGFAHVQFEEVAGAAAAIAMSGAELEGRALFIDSAKERPPSANTPNSNRKGEANAFVADVKSVAQCSSKWCKSSMLDFQSFLPGSTR